MKIISNMKKNFWNDCGTALIALASIFSAFLFFEPTLGRAIEDQFTITQTITSEISFSTTASDVTMNSSIGGLTGGVSNGTTTVVVLTNDSAGYTMTIKASSSPAMQGNSQGGTISDYTSSSASIPDFSYSVPSSAEFGYSVSASTTADLAQKFLDNGSTCNTGSSDTSGAASCWFGLSTTATSTILRTSETSASGSTSSIYFKLTVNSGTALPEDTYVATTTLTATTN